MPVLDGEDKAAAAGSQVITLQKPVPEAVIRKITLMSTNPADFVTAFAKLEQKDKTAHHIPIGRRISQNCNFEGFKWVVSQKWYDNFQLKIRYYAQNAGTWFYTVEYDIIEPEPKKRRWGQ